MFTTERLIQLSSSFAFAMVDMHNHTLPKNKRWTRGGWGGKKSLVSKMLSYGKGCKPKLTKKEVEMFIIYTPEQIAERFTGVGK